MFENALSAEAVQEALEILQHEFPLALWETVYVTLLSTAFCHRVGAAFGHPAGGRRASGRSAPSPNG